MACEDGVCIGMNTLLLSTDYSKLFLKYGEHRLNTKRLFFGAENIFFRSLVYGL